MKKIAILLVLLPLQLWAHLAQPTLSPPHSEITEALAQELKGHNFRIPAHQAQALAQQFGISMDQLLIELSKYARAFSNPAISHYQVGIAALAGDTHNIYLGINLEFPVRSLRETVHGEQFAVALAHYYEETGIEAIATAEGKFCGYCRQFLMELDPSPRMIMLNSVNELTVILPHAFGPRDLKAKSSMLTHGQVSTQLPGSPNRLTILAGKAASLSYAPYTKAYSGVAVQLKDNTLFSGSYLESAAFNPSLSPLQSALVALVAKGRRMDEIKSVVLVESPKASHLPSQDSATRSLLKSIAKRAKYKRVEANFCEHVFSG